MIFLRVCVTLWSVIALSKAGPINSTSSHHKGRCQYTREMDNHDSGAFIPECDSEGNYLPQQCCLATGYCWCVNIITGEEIYNTKGPQSSYHYDCVKDYYCPFGWLQHGKQCFIFIDYPKTWIQAQMYCEFEGGNLASIHSEKEYHSIQSLTRGDTHEFPLTWLGGQDAIKKGYWMWNDGTKFDFENWYMGHSIGDENENCLLMNYEYGWNWHYSRCNMTLPSVCSKSSYYYY